jgi:glycine/D-amino acid oxidase-like deaminating enzyme
MSSTESEQESEQGWFNLQTGTVVTDVQMIGNGWIVHTERGQVAAENVLLACNGYVSSILPQFTGLITPVQGQVASLRPQSTKLGHTYIFLAEPEDGPVMDDYLVQAIGGEKELVLGGGRVLGKARGRGISDDDFLDETVSHHLRTILKTVLDMHAGENSPQGESVEMDASFEWTGIMGYSADGRPWVGAVPESLGGGPGMYIAAGYTGHGMPVAALVARAVVRMMAGQREDPIPEEYMVSLERIETVRTAPVLKGELLDEVVMDVL